MSKVQSRTERRSHAEADPDEAGLGLWLAAVGRGEREALAVLYGRTHAHLYAILLRMLKEWDRAEEALHEVYLKVWRNAAGYDPARGPAMAWLVGVARHTALDKLRRLRRELALDDVPGIIDELADDGADPSAEVLASAEARRLQACLEELEPEPRACIALAYWDGLTHEELAHRLQRPVGTVKSWLRRSLIRLKQCLEA